MRILLAVSGCVVSQICVHTATRNEGSRPNQVPKPRYKQANNSLITLSHFGDRSIDTILVDQF